MAITYEKIASSTLSSAAASITLSSIPATFTDLRVAIRALANTGTTNCYFLYNNDTTANYAFTNVRGTGGSTATTTFSSNAQLNIGFTASASTTVPANYFADIFSYAGSTFKTTLTNAGTPSAYERHIGLWKNTSAINRIDIYPNSADNFAAGTTVTIYGILKA